MLTKAIILSIDYTSNLCTVRIPVFEMAGNIYKNEAVAITSITPGAYNGYKENDVVIVGFENHEAGKPIILGKLYLGAKEESQANCGAIKCNDLNVINSATLPANTNISYSNENMTVTNGEISLSNYNSIHDIVTAVKDQSQQLATLNNNINFKNKISTTPHISGLWIDERNIFQKTFVYDFISNNIGQSTNSAWNTEIILNLDSLDWIILTDYSFIKTNNSQIILDKNNKTYNYNYDLTTSKLSLNGTTGNYTLTTGYFTVEYVKNN